MVRTHYDNLQVSRNASPEVIKGAYKYLMQKWHPDKNPANKDRAARVLQLINRAHEVLSDPQLRKEHDDWIARQESDVAASKHAPSSAPDATVDAQIPQPTAKANFMNFVKGGPRVTLVLSLLLLLFIGGITVNLAFFDPIGKGKPAWADGVLGACMAALVLVIGSHEYMKDITKQPEFTGSAAIHFVGAIWGMAASFLGWIVGLFCITAFLGGWEPMVSSWFFNSVHGVFLFTMFASILIFIAPIAVIWFFAWLGDGFSSK